MEQLTLSAEPSSDAPTAAASTVEECNEVDPYEDEDEDEDDDDDDDDEDEEDDDDDDEDDDGPVHDHDATVFDVLNIAEPDYTQLHYGFEIELNTSGRDVPAELFIARANGRGIVKRDSSIGSYGIELVSIPLSLSEIRALIADAFPNNRLRNTFVDSTCGMHVHVSRAPLAGAQLAKLVRFMHTPRNATFIEYLAGRRLRGSRWANIDHRGPSWKSIYVNASNSSWLPAKPIYRMIDGYRYSALNLTNTTTIEFRIFASTTDVNRACANVESCAALVAFCGIATTSLAQCDRYEAFIAFVSHNRADYPNLAGHLEIAYSHLIAPRPVAQTRPLPVAA